ncbi:MAG: BrnA antitoxin family protein [Clostridia bacterium]|nr:BrnA antitoxin family protein [Clostridia bacterium]
MRDHYDFSNGEKNPYAAQLKKQVTINLDAETVEYFKAQAEETGIPYQRLINFYLADCVKNNRRLAWTS